MIPTKLTIVIPVFNEETVVEYFHKRISSVLDGIKGVNARIIYVVDRCTDNSLEVLRTIAQRDIRTTVIALSARFGHQMSLLAGIEKSLESDAIIMMDSDLQHPPELIPELLRHFRDGADVVYTLRKDTDEINNLRKRAGNIFYRLINYLSDTTINPNAADFRLISQRVAHLLSSSFHERHLFLRGLFSWIGFKQVGVEYIAEKRIAGSSKYSFSRMLQFALAGIVSFSTKPLQIGVFIGGAFALFAVFIMILTVGNYFIDRSLPSGWTTIVTLLLMFNSIQLMTIGILGIYIGNICDEVKRRPRYIISEEIH